MVWPGAAVSITTLAFNLLEDGLRDARSVGIGPLTRAKKTSITR